MSKEYDLSHLQEKWAEEGHLSVVREEATWADFTEEEKKSVRAVFDPSSQTP